MRGTGAYPNGLDKYAPTTVPGRDTEVCALIRGNDEG